MEEIHDKYEDPEPLCVIHPPLLLTYKASSTPPMASSNTSSSDFPPSSKRRIISMGEKEKKRKREETLGKLKEKRRRKEEERAEATAPAGARRAPPRRRTSSDDSPRPSAARHQATSRGAPSASPARERRLHPATTSRRPSSDAHAHAVQPSGGTDSGDPSGSSSSSDGHHPIPKHAYRDDSESVRSPSPSYRPRSMSPAPTRSERKKISVPQRASRRSSRFSTMMSKSRAKVRDPRGRDRDTPMQVDSEEEVPMHAELPPQQEKEKSKVGPTEVKDRSKPVKQQSKSVNHPLTTEEKGEGSRRQQPQAKGKEKAASVATEQIPEPDSGEYITLTEASSRSLAPNKYLDPSAMETMQISGKVAEYLAAIGWTCLLELPHVVYPPFVRGFYSTFRYNEKAASNPSKSVISFQYNGEFYSLSIVSFNRYLGSLPFDKDYKDPAHEDTLVTVPKDFNCTKVWQSLTRDSRANYDSRHSQDKHLIDPALIYLHRFLCFLFTSKSNSSSIVARKTLEILWAMKNELKLNLGVWVARRLQEVTKSKEGVSLPLAALITMLGSNMKIVDLKKLHKTRLTPVAPLSVSTLVLMTLVKKEDGKYSWTHTTPEEEEEAHPLPRTDMLTTEVRELHKTITTGFTTITARLERLEKRVEDIAEDVAYLRQPRGSYDPRDHE